MGEPVRLRRLFQPDARNRSEEHQRVYAAYELWYTAVDVAAAVSFVAGSLLFLSETTQTAGTWLFVAGSIFFLMKPVIRLMRELRFVALGDVKTLAERAGWSEGERPH